MHHLLSAILTYRIAKRIWRRSKQRYWRYILSILFFGGIGGDMAIAWVFGSAEESALAGDVVTGVLLFVVVGFSAVYLLSRPEPSELEILQKAVRRKLSDALIDGSADEQKIQFWTRFLEESSHDYQ
ncbi:MAG: hypothetical protein AAFY20_23375 [Cyanobacteria bacterium J06639_14]